MMDPTYSSDSDEQSYCLVSTESESIRDSDDDSEGFVVIKVKGFVELSSADIFHSEQIDSIDSIQRTDTKDCYQNDISFDFSPSSEEFIVENKVIQINDNSNNDRICDISVTIKEENVSDKLELIMMNTFKEERRVNKGHTFRKNLYNKNDCEISSVSRFYSKFDNGDVEVSVSNIDIFFEPSFAALKNIRNRTLKKHNNFEEVLEALEKECVSKSVIVNKYNFSVETIYTVPAIGFQLFEEVDEKNSFLCPSEYKNTKITKSDQLIYKGKAYDISYIYLLDLFAKNPLKQLCKLTTQEPTFDDNKLIKSLDFSLKRNMSTHMKGQVMLHSSKNKNYFRYNAGWGQNGENDFLEIDLGSSTYVTHIGTAGMYPNLDVFPKRKTHSKKENNKKRQFKRIKGRANKSTAFVHVVNSMDDLAWVTEYDLFYKDDSTKKWIFIGRFDGNNDSTGEKINSLNLFFNSHHGLLIRHLRIQPVQYYNKPFLRLAVYGINRRSIDGCAVIEDVVEKENEIIEYTIKSACAEENFVDGRGMKGCRCCCWDIRESEHKKRNRLQRIIKEDRFFDL